MKNRTIYPFTAIVGQEKMKLALMLNVVNPGLSGVLIRGEKGTAKSTAVRALADILPEIAVFAGSSAHG
ncbi:MAG: magnesium chelatase ATPase subunit I, partial [Opitutae bacterium]|nr:magnesium chelatase ATPase subunit I [Opitutae bacterium]